VFPRSPLLIYPLRSSSRLFSDKLGSVQGNSPSLPPLPLLALTVSRQRVHSSQLKTRHLIQTIFLNFLQQRLVAYPSNFELWRRFQMSFPQSFRMVFFSASSAALLAIVLIFKDSFSSGFPCMEDSETVFLPWRTDSHEPAGGLFLPEEDRPLNHIFKLPDISRPIVFLKNTQSFWRIEGMPWRILPCIHQKNI